MGVYIPNKKMPKSCNDCDPDFAYFYECELWKTMSGDDFISKRHDDCPLIEIDLERDIPTVWYNRQTGQYEPKGTKQEVYERLYKLKYGERSE